MLKVKRLAMFGVQHHACKIVAKSPAQFLIFALCFFKILIALENLRCVLNCIGKFTMCSTSYQHLNRKYCLA